MRALLDTHAFLWWIADDSRLSRRARETIADASNQVLFSATSAWEIAIKARLGRLSIPRDVGRFVTRQVGINGFLVLPVNLAHALRTYSLPEHHRDPFDRMLVAQAQVENLVLITGDLALAPYQVRTVW